MGLVGLLLLGVTLRGVVLPDGVMVPLPLPLPEVLGGASGTLGCVSVSDSAACTVRSLPILLLLGVLGHCKRPRRLERGVQAASRVFCENAAPRKLLCIAERLFAVCVALSLWTSVRLVAAVAQISNPFLLRSTHKQAADTELS
jgi:hypothetical protein